MAENLTSGVACPWEIAPKLVLTASHPFGGCGACQRALETTTASAAGGIARRGARTQAVGRIAVAINPSQAVPGNTRPAELSGEAQPMIPNGGTALVATASGTRHRR